MTDYTVHTLIKHVIKSIALSEWKKTFVTIIVIGFIEQKFALKSEILWIRVNQSVSVEEVAFVLRIRIYINYFANLMISGLCLCLHMPSVHLRVNDGACVYWIFYSIYFDFIFSSVLIYSDCTLQIHWLLSKCFSASSNLVKNTLYC